MVELLVSSLTGELGDSGKAFYEQLFNLKCRYYGICMGARNKACTILLVGTLILLFTIPTATSESTQKTSNNFIAQYTLFNENLFVSIQPSLYAYYSNLSHVIPHDSDYAKFITPQTVQPIADNILKITQNTSYPEEQFANAVLSFVHQIPYNITGAKFPVEVLIDNRGDCGALSILAASIMKAGGLDVVLIKYTGTDFAHMNIGVYLPYTPVNNNLFLSSTSFDYNNKTYWTAEATPEANWKVGDQSLRMANAITQIIPLEGSEQSSPGQISCSLSPLSPSTITVNLLSPPNTQANRSLVISGSVEPIIPNSPITIYLNKNGSCIDFVKTVTDDNGSYTLFWNFTSDGTYYISASCIGNATYAGADSEPLVVFIGPKSLLQFQTDTYNYIVGRAIGDIAIRPYMGVNDFLNIPLGTNVSFSYSFLVLQTGQSAPDIPTKNITIPASQHTIRDRNRHTQIVQVPAKTLIVPASIPLGLEPLTLPDDFNQTINNQFCFIVQKDPKGNYSLTAQGLDDYDVRSVKTNNETSTVFFNASQGIAESTWYKVKTSISQNGITTNLQNESGTPIKSLSTPDILDCSTKLVLLVANNVDSAIVLKDFQVNDGAATVQPIPQIIRLPPAPMESPLPFIITVVILAATFIVAAAVIDVKKTKKRQLID